MKNGYLLRAVEDVVLGDLDTTLAIVDFIVVGFGDVGVGVVDFSVVGRGASIPEQAFSPSLRVCSNLVSPLRPHFPSQDPPLPQHVGTPLLLRPHLGHAMCTIKKCDGDESMLV